jgi:hypothetical protein
MQASFKSGVERDIMQCSQEMLEGTLNPLKLWPRSGPAEEEDKP